MARRVNDAISDDGRSALTSFIPALVGTHAQGAWVYAAIAVACTGTALERCPASWLRALDSAARARADARDTGRHRLYVHGTAYRSVDLAVFWVAGLEQPEADEALKSLLEGPSRVSRLTGPSRRSPIRRPNPLGAG